MKSIIESVVSFSLITLAIGCVILIPVGILVWITADDPAEIQKMNHKTFSSQGEYIETLPDGRKIFRYELKIPDRNSHFIYVVPNSVTTSTNYDVQSGKSSYNQTVVKIEKWGTTIMKTNKINSASEEIIQMKISMDESMNDLRKKFYKIMRKYKIKKGEKQPDGGILENNYEWTAMETLFFSMIQSAFTWDSLMGNTPKDLKC